MRTSKLINTMVVATMIIHAVVDTVVETLGVEEEQVAEEEEVVEAEEATVVTKIWVVIMTEVTEAAKQCVFRIMSQLRTDSSA